MAPADELPSLAANVTTSATLCALLPTCHEGGCFPTKAPRPNHFSLKRVQSFCTSRNDLPASCRGLYCPLERIRRHGRLEWSAVAPFDHTPVSPTLQNLLTIQRNTYGTTTVDCFLSKRLGRGIELDNFPTRGTLNYLLLMHR